MQDEISEDVHTAERHCLRDSPLHGAVFFAAGWRDGEAFRRTPECGRRIVVAAGGVDMHVAGDVDRVRRGAETDDGGVEADGDVEVVVAGSEEDGVAVGAELAMLLRGVDGVDFRLRLGDGCGGRDEQDAGAEVGRFLRDGDSGEYESDEGRESNSHGNITLPEQTNDCLYTLRHLDTLRE